MLEYLTYEPTIGTPCYSESKRHVEKFIESLWAHKGCQVL